MNLLENIHELWAADAVLAGMLAASRVSTGEGKNASLPFAVWTKDSQRPVMISNDGETSDEVGLRCQIFHKTYDVGDQIANRCKAVFHNGIFELESCGGSSSGITCCDTVMVMRRSNDFEIEEDDGVWRFVIDFIAKVHLPGGV